MCVITVMKLFTMKFLLPELLKSYLHHLNYLQCSVQDYLNLLQIFTMNTSKICVITVMKLFPVNFLQPELFKIVLALLKLFTV